MKRKKKETFWWNEQNSNFSVSAKMHSGADSIKPRKKPLLQSVTISSLRRERWKLCPKGKNAELYKSQSINGIIKHLFGRNQVPNMLSTSWRWINQFGNCLQLQRLSSLCFLLPLSRLLSLWAGSSSLLLLMLSVLLVSVITWVDLFYGEMDVSHFPGSISTFPGVPYIDW